jgi:hypothetical protein
MDDQGHKSKPCRRWPTYLTVALILALVAYPLSIGPAAVIAHRCRGVVPEGVWMIYWPILAAIEATGSREIYKSYALWWFQFTNTDIPG